jgi:hypothetical protein
MRIGGWEEGSERVKKEAAQGKEVPKRRNAAFDAFHTMAQARDTHCCEPAAKGNDIRGCALKKKQRKGKKLLPKKIPKGTQSRNFFLCVFPAVEGKSIHPLVSFFFSFSSYSRDFIMIS